MASKLGLCLCIVLFLCFILPVWGTLLLEENFVYSPGSTLVSNGWHSHYNVGTNPPVTADSGLNYAGYPPANGMSGQTVGNGESISKGFSPLTSGSIYCSFLLKANSFPTGANADFPFHFGDSTVISGTSTGSHYFGRLFLQYSNNLIRFGISKSSTNPAIIQWTSYNYQTGTTYLLVMKYTFLTGINNDMVKLWINPASPMVEPNANLIIGGGDSNADPTELACIALKQSMYTPQANFDGFRVALTWSELFANDTVPLATPVLHISQVNNNTTLSWNAVPGATNYRIEASAFPNSGYVGIATVNANTWSEVSTNPRRFFRVIAQ